MKECLEWKIVRILTKITINWLNSWKISLCVCFCYLLIFEVNLKFCKITLKTTSNALI